MQNFTTPSPTGQYTLWEASVSLAYGRAIERYPSAQCRIKKGAQLAAADFAVADLESGSRVQSSDGKRWYTIDGGQCDCPDRTPRCKHRWALALYRCATQIQRALYSQRQQWVATDARTGESGVLHAERVEVEQGMLVPAGVLFFVPYGGPWGYFIAPWHAVLGTHLLAFAPA